MIILAIEFKNECMQNNQLIWTKVNELLKQRKQMIGREVIIVKFSAYSKQYFACKCVGA